VTATVPRVRRRILLVAYYYPPLNSIGARRPAALAKWLRRRGHEVTVLTSLHSGLGADDCASRVVRTRDLLTTRLNWRRGAAAAAAQGNATWSPGPGFWGSLVVPDIQLVSWMPFAVAAALRLERELGYDAVVTSSPLESAHAVGLALRRRGVPWIVDLRDGWRFEAPRGEFPLAAQRRIDDALERLVVARADAIVMVTEPLSDDLRRRYGVTVETITNGFDPDDSSSPGPAPVVPDPAKLTLAHTGSVSGRQTLRPLLEGLARLAAADPTVHERVELVLAGRQTEEQRALYAQPAFAPFIRHAGFLPRDEALALQRSADVLVLVTSGIRRGEATGKLFEYLAAGRPILVLGAGSAGGDIVTNARAGIAIPTGDADAAEEVLRRLLADGLPNPPAAARAPYAYPAIAERYEALIERTIAARSG
jgi:glycosyltransferase involved in cell wall biosynthesis